MKTPRFERKQFTQSGKRAAGKRGLTILFIGDGKGKTTAAVGIAVRAAGSGLRVCMLQFMKSPKWQSYERQALKRLGVPVHVMGSGFVGIIDDAHPVSWHRKQAKLALAKTRQVIRSKKYDVVIADEAVTAIDEKLLAVRDLTAIIHDKPGQVHLILTGHSRYPALEKLCDTITLMKNIKHPYYTEGLLAQRGIDF